MTLTVMTYNTLFAGRDGPDDARARAQVGIINREAPDVLMLQEARGFEASGGAALHALEDEIGMRGFLAQAPRTGQNVAVFVRDTLRPLSFEADGSNFHHALATLRVAVRKTGRHLTLVSAHLCPNGAVVRRREAAYLGPLADAEAHVLLAGDFNSASPHDEHPSDFATLPRHHRARYLAEDRETIDRSVLAHLEAAGWVDLGHGLGGAATPTVPTAGHAGTEFATMRCDFVLASAAMAATARAYAVLKTPETDVASDHYPVVATFDLEA